MDTVAVPIMNVRRRALFPSERPRAVSTARRIQSGAMPARRSIGANARRIQEYLSKLT